jgi:predicted DNA-binding transcriptional regulator YafY
MTEFITIRDPEGTGGPRPASSGYTVRSRGPLERTERFYRIEQMLRQRRVVPIDELLSELSISLATFKRDLQYLRDRHHAPIVWDSEARGYKFDLKKGVGPKFELPGVWFSASEILALLTMEHLLEKLEPGLLARHIESLRDRLSSMLETGDHSAQEVRKRVRVNSLAARKRDLRCFQTIGSALLNRKRLKIEHFSRQRVATTEREVSPQRLVYYRENWYLDAWCHRSDAIRTFAVETIKKARTLDERARDLPDKDLDAVLKDGYGIFSGKAVAWAKLKFTALRARWVSTEQWHERQKSTFNADGSYTLDIPYADDRELVMDIMRYGPDCQVLEPQALKEKVKALHEAAADQYRPDKAAKK